MRLTQILTPEGKRAIVVRQHEGTIAEGPPRLVPGATTLYALALEAIAEGRSLKALVKDRLEHNPSEPVNLPQAYEEGRVLAPLDHPDPAHLVVSGTGLTHLGSAEGRDKMHKAMSDPAKQTDSMRMFKLGVEGGKPADGAIGAQPEWFYKGDGGIVVNPGAPFPSPAFGLDGGEEPEIVGLYVIAEDGTPWRIGFALGNEFSDHVTERGNYLWLAHSKLRACSFGPEVVLGEFPTSIVGTSKIVRDGATLWEKPFLSGEINMCHALDNLERHHFKYAQFRRPGDAHAHFFGTATLSFSDGVQTQPGDVFEVSADGFGLPLRNALAVVDAPYVTPKAL